MARADLERQRRTLRRRFAVVIGIALVTALAVYGVLAALAMDSDTPIAALVSAAVTGLLVLAAIAWFTADRFFVRPLNELTAEIRFLSEAARDVKIEPRRYPDFAPLPQLANDVISRVAATRQEIERSVAAATRRAEEQKGLLESILRDLSEGVIACSLDHRILLYNQVAMQLVGQRSDLGLGRSVFNVLTDEPIRHTLDRLTHRELADIDPTAPLVCATVDARSLLRGRMMLLSAGGAPTGYILTLADVTHELAELDRRDRLLRSATDDLRAPLASLRAASETLASFPDIAPERRREFEQVIQRETEALTQRLEAIDRDRRELTAGHWPMADIHSVDLLNCVIRRLADSGGPAVTMVGLPLWLHGDSLSLVVALERLMFNLAAETGRRSFDIEALLGDRRVYVEASWDGPPVSVTTIDAWRAAPLSGALGAQTLDDILTRHGSEMWSRALPARPGASERAVLRLPLSAPSRVQFEPPGAPLPSRPEFYDFGLMHLDPTNRNLEAQSLRSVPYVVFDTETTGLNPSQGDEIIAVGAVRVTNGRILTGETFSRLLNPKRAIPPASTRFHNITDAMVREAPPLEVVLPQFRTFVGGAVLVAHNAAFDLKFIRMKAPEGSSWFDIVALDTMLISMFLYPELPHHNLDAISHRLGVEVAGRHSALGDALATAAVFVRLLDLLEARGITTLGALTRASNMALDIRMRQEHF